MIFMFRIPNEPYAKWCCCVARLHLVRSLVFPTPRADPLLVAAWAEVAFSGPAGHIVVSRISEEELDADEDCCPGAGRPRGLDDWLAIAGELLHRIRLEMRSSVASLKAAQADAVGY